MFETCVYTIVGDTPRSSKRMIGRNGVAIEDGSGVIEQKKPQHEAEALFNIG
jgi:hypothetical protein